MTAKVYKRAKVLTAFGEDVFTVLAWPDEDWAAIVTITEGNSTRLEITPRLFKQNARSFVDKELDRYDVLGIGATGRIAELEAVNA